MFLAMILIVPTRSAWYFCGNNVPCGAAAMTHALVLLSCLVADVEKKPADVKRPPNVVLVLTDDQGYGDHRIDGVDNLDLVVSEYNKDQVVLLLGEGSALL